MEQIGMALQLAENIESDVVTAETAYDVLRDNPNILKFVVKVWSDNNKSQALQLLANAKFEKMLVCNES